MGTTGDVRATGQTLFPVTQAPAHGSPCPKRSVNTSPASGLAVISQLHSFFENPTLVWYLTLYDSNDILTHLPISSPLRAGSFLHSGVFRAPPPHSPNTPCAQQATGLPAISGEGLNHLAVTEDWPWSNFPQPLQVHLHL